MISQNKKNLLPIKSDNKIFLHYQKPKIDISEFSFLSVDKLETLDNNSVQEFFILDLLEFFEDNHIDYFLSVIYSKLTNNGKLIIQGLDAYNLCSSMVYKQIDLDTFRALIFSFGKKNIFNIARLDSFIKNNGFSIEQKKFINGLQYYMQYTKNE
jgi:hypothetical protein